MAEFFKDYKEKSNDEILEIMQKLFINQVIVGFQPKVLYRLGID